MPRTLFLITLAILLCGCVSSDEYLRVCHYTNWAQYRPESCRFLPEDIDPDLCSHIVYNFAVLKNHSVKPTEFNDEQMYARMLDLKKINPELKVILAIGLLFGTDELNKTLATHQTREMFINDSIVFLRKRGFDGLDLDFGFPKDKKGYISLVEEMSAAYKKEGEETGKPRLLLTTHVPALDTVMNKSHEVDKLQKHFDFVTVGTYDLYVFRSNFTALHAPLYSRKEDIGTWKGQLSVDWAVRQWIKLGLPASKLVMGIAAYGRTYVLKDISKNGVGAPTNTSELPERGWCLRTPGMLSLTEICENKNLVHKWDNKQKGPYAYDPLSGNPWASYDNKASVEAKVAYLKFHHLAGVSMWSLSMDDFNGEFCDQGRYPLLKAINQRLQGHGSCSHGECE